jgi:hypothetical protein
MAAVIAACLLLFFNAINMFLFKKKHLLAVIKFFYYTLQVVNGDVSSPTKSGDDADDGGKDKESSESVKGEADATKTDSGDNAGPPTTSETEKPAGNGTPETGTEPKVSASDAGSDDGEKKDLRHQFYKRFFFGTDDSA